MEALKSIFKFMVISTLVVGGALAAVTAFAAKGIDQLGDRLLKKRNR